MNWKLIGDDLEKLAEGALAEIEAAVRGILLGHDPEAVVTVPAKSSTTAAAKPTPAAKPAAKAAKPAKVEPDAPKA